MNGEDRGMKRNDRSVEERIGLIREFRELESLFKTLKNHTTLDDYSEMVRVTEAVISSIGEAMFESDRRDVASMLPASIGKLLCAAQGERIMKIESLERRVSTKLHVTLADAQEHIVAVCQGLVHFLDEEDLTIVRARIPEEIAELLKRVPVARRREFGRGARTTSPPSRTLNTLASGNPESRRPISESIPGQRNSPAVTTKPRMKRKISTSDGTPSFGYSLSEGRDGSDRPLSETNPE